MKHDASQSVQAAIWFDIFNKTFYYVLEGFSFSASAVEKVYWMGQSATFAFYIFVIKIVAECEDAISKRKASFIIKIWLGFAVGDFIDECLGNIIPNSWEYITFFATWFWIIHKLKEIK